MQRGAWLVIALVGCGDNLVLDEPIEQRPPGSCDDANLPATLAALPKVREVTEAECGDYVGAPARCFAIRFEQPIHHAAAQPAFRQRLFLVHRGCDRPTVVADWGYSQDVFFDDELATLFDANALWIEHRYQGESLPEPAAWDWTALTIENGARDMHEVIAAFRTHYGDRFVTTGASKGGITATYHRYFFPDDVDGTIPYVAPASRARIDPAYQDYLASALPQPCSQQLRDAQVAALTTRRPMMLQRLAQLAPGNEALYLEYIVRSFDWAFWQYYGVELCDGVPTAASTDDAFWRFFANLSGLGPAAGPAEPDQAMSDGALYYEWLTEQGFALQTNPEVARLLREPLATSTMEEDLLALYPGVALPPYQGKVTHTVRAWMERQAEDMLLIYGEYDPWSGGAMAEPAAPTSARLFVPAATHSAQISALSFDAHTIAIAHASRMFGHEPVARKPAAQRAGQYVREQLLRREREVELRTKLLRRQSELASSRP